MADGRDEIRQKDRTSNKYAAKKAATERLAVQRAAQQRADRRRNLMIVGSSTIAVLIVIAVIVVVGVTHKNKPSGTTPVAASSSVTKALSSAATSTLTTQLDPKAASNPPIPINNGTPLTSSGGLPQVLYVGAEYCPNCAATRWPLALALSRFGEFSGLQTMYSSEDSIPTLSFHGSSYTSKYVAFDGKEQVDQQNKPFESLSPQESKLFSTLGVAPGQSSPGYPFIDFGGKWRQNGTVYDFTILKGMSPKSVAASLSDPTSKAGKAIQASADIYTAIICDMDGGQPAKVCTAPAVATAKTMLNAS